MVYYVLRETYIKYNYKKNCRIMKKSGMKAEMRIRKIKDGKKTFTNVTRVQLNDYLKGYLSLILDGFNNAVIDYAFAKRNDKNLIADSPEKLSKKIIGKKPIINSSHGSIYFSKNINQ